MSLPQNPFEIFGLEQTFDIDLEALDRKYLELTRSLHPDRHAARLRQTNTEESKRTQIEMQAASAQVNGALKALQSSEERLETLLELIGALPKEGATSKKENLDLETAERFFEIQDLAMEDAGEATAKALDLKKELLSRKNELEEKIYSFARQQVWRKEKADSVLTAKILDLRRQLAYLKSILNNLSGLCIRFSLL